MVGGWDEGGGVRGGGGGLGMRSLDKKFHNQSTRSPNGRSIKGFARNVDGERRGGKQTTVCGEIWANLT